MTMAKIKTRRTPQFLFGLFVAAMLFAHAAVFAREIDPSIMTKSVQPVCDALNSPRKGRCAYNQKSAQPSNSVAKPKPTAPLVREEQGPKPVSRCDPQRRDEPERSVLRSSRGQSIPVGVVSEWEAHDLFRYFANQRARYSLNANSFADKTCAQRSHLIAHDLQVECRMSSAKIYAQGGRSWLSLYLSRSSLRVQGADGDEHNWDWHVANVIMVKTGEVTKPYVIDPVLFKDIVPMEKWKGLINSQNAGAVYTTTSGANYRLSEVGSDDPENPILIFQAQEDLKRARAEYKKINSF